MGENERGMDYLQQMNRLPPARQKSFDSFNSSMMTADNREMLGGGIEISLVHESRDKRCALWR